MNPPVRTNDQGNAGAFDAETAAGERFRFGANWSRFLAHVDAVRIADAEESLRRMLGVTTLQGRRFLDAGSGSGLFSLAARRLGASVHSFDFDPQSVACTQTLKQRFRSGDSEAEWRVEPGSVLDDAYLEGLGRFDVVYSWGVLHHTGRMWAAIDKVAQRVLPHGRLFISIYNDQGFISRFWLFVKRLYNRSALARVLLVAVFTPYSVWLRWTYRRLTGKGKVERGMTLWYDMIDWLGGYPYEVATPEAVFRHVAAQGFELRELVTEGRRSGCIEFVFERVRDADPAPLKADPAVPRTAPQRAPR